MLGNLLVVLAHLDLGTLGALNDTRGIRDHTIELNRELEGNEDYIQSCTSDFACYFLKYL